MVARDGIEPPTPAFSGPRSTIDLSRLKSAEPIEWKPDRSRFKWMDTLIFDIREVPDTKESVEAAKQEAQQVVQLWDRRALYATVTFVLSCGSVYPFSGALVLMSMALLRPFVICV